MHLLWNLDSAHCSFLLAFWLASLRTKAGLVEIWTAIMCRGFITSMTRQRTNTNWRNRIIIAPTVRTVVPSIWQTNLALRMKIAIVIALAVLLPAMSRFCSQLQSPFSFRWFVMPPSNVRHFILQCTCRKPFISPFGNRPNGWLKTASAWRVPFR